MKKVEPHKNFDYRARDKAAGMKRREVYLDDATYDRLLQLLEHAGYKTSVKREVKQGISGVLLHLVLLASSKNNIDKVAGKKAWQQKVLLARLADKLIRNRELENPDGLVEEIFLQYPEGKEYLRSFSNRNAYPRAIKKFIAQYKK